MSETFSLAVNRSEQFRVDLRTTGILSPLPAALLAGQDRDLLSPLRYLDPGDLPSSPPPQVDRRSLARALVAVNRSYGHPRADDLGRRLADPTTRVVVAGQQPGLLGGPLYTLAKMVAAVRWAQALEEAGQPAVAVFWVATEDHDYGEISTTTILAPDGPKSLDLGPDPAPLTPAGMRHLGPGVEEILTNLAQVVPGERYAEWIATLRSWYRPAARFGEAFSRLMVRLLGERAPLLLDAMHPVVKEAEAPWLRRFVEAREEVERQERAAETRIQDRGYSLQVNPQPGASPLFWFHRGERRRVEWRGAEGFALRGHEEVSGPVATLLAAVDENPSAVSPGVLARPVIQDALLGTTLQIVGQGELAYMAQAAALYPVLEVPAPWVTLRPLTLVLEAHQVHWMEELDLTLGDLLGEASALDQLLARRVDARFVEEAQSRVEELLADLRVPALDLDPNLERPWEKTRDQILRALDLFSEKVMAAAARRNQVEHHRVDLLRATCLPFGKLQERLISAVHFYGKYREEFVESYFRSMDLDPIYLQVICPKGE